MLMQYSTWIAFSCLYVHMPYQWMLFNICNNIWLWFTVKFSIHHVHIARRRKNVSFVDHIILILNFFLMYGKIYKIKLDTEWSMTRLENFFEENHATFHHHRNDFIYSHKWIRQNGSDHVQIQQLNIYKDSIVLKVILYLFQNAVT